MGVTSLGIALGEGSEDGLCCGCCCRSERLPFANLNAAAVVELLRRPRKMFPHFSTPPQKRKRSPLPHSPSPPLFLAPPRALVGDSRAPVLEEWRSGLSLEIWQVEHITFMGTKACMQDLEAELFICSSHVRAVVEMGKKKKENTP